MDWYFGNGIDDLVVPRDQDLSDGFPSSPEFWSKWGTCDSGNFVSPNKCFDMDNMMEEEFELNGLCSEEMETCTCDYKDQCSGSAVCGGSSEDSLQGTVVSCDHEDYQLDHFAGIEQLDDIFLDSLLEDLPRNEDVHKSFCFTPESQCYLLPANCRSTEVIFDSQSNLSDKHSKGSSKYLKTHAFSPSVGWEKDEVTDSSFSPCNLEQRDLSVKAPLAKVQVPSEQNGANGYVGEMPSVEESVLQDLKMVMAQLTDETRICFRDAFYRLAKNSRHHVEPLSQNGDFSSDASPGTDHDISNRSGKRKPTESETNVFDRAIANLVFDKMDLNVQEFPTTAAIYPTQDVTRTTGSPDHGSSNLRGHRFCHSMLTGDAEVPRLGKKHLEIAANPNQDFSKGLAENCVYENSEAVHRFSSVLIGMYHSLITYLDASVSTELHIVHVSWSSKGSVLSRHFSLVDFLSRVIFSYFQVKSSNGWLHNCIARLLPGAVCGLYWLLHFSPIGGFG